jgi:superoxide dismutase, Fe-Mn family
MTTSIPDSDQNSQTIDASNDTLMPRRQFLRMAATLGGSALALSQLRIGALAATTASAKSQAPLTPLHQKHSSQAKVSPAASHPVQPYDAKTTIQPKTFPHLTQVEGISQNQLNQHVELYHGYVKKINDLDSQIQSASDEMLTAANATYAPFRELHLEQTYALNGVILHEYYFENLGMDNGGLRKGPENTEFFHATILKEFGTWDHYIAHLKAVGKSARGWAITGYNMRDHRIHNYGLDMHNANVPIHVIPLLVLDVYEHAYMIDFGTKRPAYLDAFLRNVNWQVADDRLKTMMFHA